MSIAEFKIDSLPSVWSLEGHIQWLVEHLIPMESVMVLTGESGSGKSTLALALAGAIAAGAPFLGKFQTQPREVLIIDRENGPAVYGERIKRIKIPQSDNLRVWGSWHNPYPEGPNSLHLRQYAAEKKPFLIFDSLIAFHPGSEQDASETRRFMESFRRLVSYGATVLIIHHSGKGENSKDYRGSTDIKASIDGGFKLEQAGSLNRLRLVPWKMREGKVSPMWIGMSDGEFVLL